MLLDRFLAILFCSVVISFSSESPFSGRIALIGDSILGSSYAGTNGAVYKHLEEISEQSVHSKWVSSQSSLRISDRFPADIPPLAPRYVGIEGGLNDLVQNIPFQTFSNSFALMLSCATSNRIAPFVIAITPWSNGTDVQMIKRDQWNIELKRLAHRRGAVFVNIEKAVGKHRPSGPEGNLWDIAPEFSIDGVHLNSSGNRLFAIEICDQYRAQAGAFDSSSNFILFRGESGRSYQIEGSANLVDWEVISSIVMQGDAARFPASHNFFRAILSFAE